jgi:hypothetical protein
MLIGYARVSKADGSQVLDLQTDALTAAGVKPSHVYTDQASGGKADRPGLETCLRSLRDGDTLVVWKLDRLGRSLRHLVTLVDELREQGVGLKVLAGEGATIDTTIKANHTKCGKDYTRQGSTASGSSQLHALFWVSYRSAQWRLQTNIHAPTEDSISLAYSGNPSGFTDGCLSQRSNLLRDSRWFCGFGSLSGRNS